VTLTGGEAIVNLVRWAAARWTHTIHRMLMAARAFDLRNGVGRAHWLVPRQTRTMYVLVG
jgi:hypothetical protein